MLRSRATETDWLAKTRFLFEFRACCLHEPQVSHRDAEQSTRKLEICVSLSIKFGRVAARGNL